MCKRNLNANILVCNKVIDNNIGHQFNGVGNNIHFNETQDGKLMSKDFFAVVCLTAVFSSNDSDNCDDFIKQETAYDFALTYYDGSSTNCPIICAFSHTFNNIDNHTDTVSFSSRRIHINILDGHISVNNSDAQYVDLMLLVRPKNDINAKWTRQTIERVHIEKDSNS